MQRSRVKTTRTRSTPTQRHKSNDQRSPASATAHISTYVAPTLRHATNQAPTVSSFKRVTSSSSITKTKTQSVIQRKTLNFSTMASTTPELDYSIEPYRKFYVSTLNKSIDDETMGDLLKEEVPLSEFASKLASQEKLTWPNQLRWNLTPEVLPSLAKNIMSETKLTLDQIASLKDGEHTYANTLGKYEDLDRNLQPFYSSLDFVSDISPNKTLRDVSNMVKETLSAFGIECNARVDIFHSVSKFAATDEAKALTGERKRALDYTMRDFKRDGMMLADDKRDELVAIRKQMSSLCIQFQQNLGEENTTFTFTKDQLDGLTEDMLSALKFDEQTNLYTVSLKTPDYIPIMKYCSVADTRKVIEHAYNSRCIKENTPLIEELVQLRHKEAQLLGYDTSADYTLETLMVKNKETVKTFLEDLNQRLTPLYKRDQESLLESKRKYYQAKGLSVDGLELHAYDRAYYSRIIEETEFAVDHNKLKEYFPIETVTKGLFSIYEQLFSIKFEEINNDTHVWHEDAKLIRILDQTTKNELGQIYLDLHPREGKYGHAAVFPLVASFIDNDGKRNAPVCGLVCNFPKPTPTKPALLPHGDVVTYFHEFGHALHHVLSMTELTRFAGTSVVRDFVECPSQLLENWCYQPESLKLMMGHFKTGELPDDDLIQKLINSRMALQGAFNKRQLVFGITDQRMHTRPSVNSAELYKEVMNEVMEISPSEGTNMIASFGHLAGGYNSRYYGYMWANVLAAAVFDKFEKGGILNTELGLKFRNEVLAKGGSIDADVLIETFLGHKPTQDAFLKQIGL